MPGWLCSAGKATECKPRAPIASMPRTCKLCPCLPGLQILAKLPVLVPAPAPGPAASSTLGGPAQLAAAATAEEGAAAADGWVPACLELRHLQPAKLAVYQAVQQQGLSVGQVAAQRRIQEDSVQVGWLRGPGRQWW